MDTESTKKNIVQDVLPPKRTIRNIEVSLRGHGSSQKSTADIFKKNIISKKKDDADFAPAKPKEKFTRSVNIRKPQKEEAPLVIIGKNPPPPPKIPSYLYQYDIPKKKSKKVLYISTIILCIVLAFGVSVLFKSAEIKISPKTLSQTFSENFTAKKDTTGSDLGYQIVTISKEMDQAVTATQDQKIIKKAQGRIIVYNTGSASQKLILGARFQTPEGLLFKSTSVVTVPGSSIKSGKSIAGSVEVPVEANAPGPTYNIGLKDFTLPGLKGDAKYTQIYARSKTGMTGGFIGTQKVVSADVLSSVDVTLENSLKQSLSKDIVSQIPSNFVLYTGGLSYTFDPSVEINSATSSAVLRKKATASAVIFDKGTLARAIIAQVIPHSVNDVIKITNLDSFIFSYPASTTPDLSTADNLNFNLSGKANFVWVFDENKLKSDLLGLPRDKATQLISTYTSVREAWVTIKPFWNNTIPTEIQKVTVVNTLPQ